MIDDSLMRCAPAPSGREPHVGDSVSFKPAAYFGGAESFGGNLDIKVHGTVERVHEAHRWYRAVYQTPQGPAFECFKF